jgi:hypothetical protein
MTYFKKKKFHPSEGLFSKFSTQKPKKDGNATKLRKMPFLK